MKIRQFLAIALVAAAAIYGGIQVVLACRGTPRPSCQQSIWLAKFAPETVTYVDGDIDVPIGLIPFVTWTLHPACADPVAATLTLTLTCTPVGGGAAITVGPESVPVEVPTVPGEQDVFVSVPGPPLSGGIFLFPIADGTLPPGDYECLVEGEYSVTFAGGTGTTAGFPINTGGGTITGVGDTTVCIVEESPDVPGEPRLDLELLYPSGADPYQVCGRGDQTCNYYLLTNNRNSTVAVNVSTWTGQVAGLPTFSNANTQAVFAIAGPAGTDAFPQAFAERQMDPLIPLVDPEEQTNRPIEKNLVLPPFGIEIIAVNIRSFGACPDGSCCDVEMRARGTYADGDQVVACAGTAYVVGPRAPKNPLCDAGVSIQTANGRNTAWTTVEFDGDPHGVFMTGNVEPYADTERPRFGGLRMQAIAQGGIDFLGQPRFNQDFVRLDHAPDHVTYGLASFDATQNFERTDNQVHVSGLMPDTEVYVPIFESLTNPKSELRVNIDYFADTIDIRLKKGRKFKRVHDGAFSEIGSSLDGVVGIQPGGGGTLISCFVPPVGNVPHIKPYGVTELIPESSGLDFGARWDITNRFGTGGFGFTASSALGDVTTPTGNPFDPVELLIANSQIAAFPDVTWGYVDLSFTTSSLVSSAYTPFAVRKVPSPPVIRSDFAITKFSAKGRFGAGKKNEKKSKVVLKGKIPVPDGFDPTGKIAFVQIGNWAFFVPLSGKGKGKEVSEVDRVKATLKVVAKKRRGTVSAQDASFTFSTKAGPLTGAFYESGLENETVSKPGRSFQVPVSIFFCGDFYDTTLSALLRSKENKSWSLSGPAPVTLR